MVLGLGHLLWLRRAVILQKDKMSTLCNLTATRIVCIQFYKLLCSSLSTFNGSLFSCVLAQRRTPMAGDHTHFGAHTHSHVTYIHMAGACMGWAQMTGAFFHFGAHKQARANPHFWGTHIHMARAHMAGVSHVTQILRSQTEYILLL